MPREFIDRDKQLGPDIHTIPGDQLRTQSAMDNMQAAPSGEPPKAFDVRAVYDSRPVQAFDFNINVAGSAVGVSSSVSVSNFTVPTGYIAVLRAFHHSLTPPPVLESRSDVLATLLINNRDVQYNQNIPVGIESDELIKCFVIADEGETLGVRLTLSGLPIGPSSIPQCHFYGQFLLKTGIPKNFEIANPTNKVFDESRFRGLPRQQPPDTPPPPPPVTPPPLPPPPLPPPPAPAPTKPQVIHRSLTSGRGR